MAGRERSWWGWGHADQQLDGDALQGLAAMVADRFGTPPAAPRPADPGRIEVATARVEPPAALAPLVLRDPVERFRRSHGNAFRDVVRALDGRLPRVTDVVVRARSADDVERVLDWCHTAGLACVPFGGGTSVVGGVTPPQDDRPVVTLDLEGLDRVTDVDAVSRAARIEGGALGPVIEDQLRPHGLTLRHFPQSWEFSTLGGWLATRAGGHYATLATRIDDLTESIEAVTPTGRWTSRRLPGSGAGPSPDRLLLGSEGSLGVITAAWMRVQPRPVHRAQASVTFETFAAGAGAVRDLAQSGLYPANCRLLDPTEALLSGAGRGDRSVLVLGFESADHGLGPWIDRALELTADHGGSCPDGPTVVTGDRTATSEGGAGEWRRTFLSAPYLRDGLVRLGLVVETFETAVTWDRFDGFVAEVTAAARAAAERLAGAAIVATRLTHAYPDGAAPYVTVIAPGGDRDPVAVWDEIKAAASEAILAGGGTITHHHAVGRDHRPWYDRQRPERFGAALTAVKATLDPAAVMNPGVLVDPAPSHERTRA